MALIKCKACGGNVSDKARVCPHCGAALTDNTKKPKAVFCKECNAIISNGVKACPNCGCPLEPENNSNVKNTSSSQASSVYKKTNSYVKIIIVLLVIATLVGYGIIYHRQNTLTGDDKVAYELVLNAAYKFKEPSSVRLLSGTVGVEKNCMWCRLSATNGFGGRSESYYFLDKDTTFNKDDAEFEEDFSAHSLENATDKLNTRKINRKLAKALGSYE